MSEENKSRQVETSQNPYDEASRLRRKRLRRRTTISCIAGVAAVIVGLFLVVVLTIAVYSRVIRDRDGEDPKLQETMGGAQVADGLLYTQADLDKRIAEAMAQAQAEIDSAVSMGQEEVLEQLKGELLEGQSALEALRPLYPDDIVLISGGKYHFVPIREDMAMHGRLQENLQVLENGRYQYVENDQVVSHMGIDVSKYQGKINWEKVAADGVEFVFLRLGLRGYESGKLVEDETFQANIKGALDHGIKVGVYFFSQAITPEEAVEEANFVLERIAPYQIECPVVFDVERVNSSTARMNALTPQERTDVTIAFLDTIEAAGYQSMFYHNMETALLLLELERLHDYDRWFAYYGEDMYYPYDYGVWQYSEKGRIAGITGDVDMNIGFNLWE
ncbi:MAG: glycoside hydrolase family 25 protein [bacterium]|nr:glycoside hydrolase family 25 protein [bacterium]MCM1375419.1 glycoside hydrolase family 25 protein [Muribaculum sp.]